MASAPALALPGIAAAVAPDPALAVIERHRTVYAAFRAVCRAEEETRGFEYRLNADAILPAFEAMRVFA